MAFKLFHKYPLASWEASLRTSGYLYINKFLVEGLVDLSQDKIENGAKLYFDEENKKLGIEFTTSYDHSDKSQRKVTKEARGCVISILPLLRFYGIGKPKERHSLIVIRQNGMLVVDLTDVPLFKKKLKRLCKS